MTGTLIVKNEEQVQLARQIRSIFDNEEKIIDDKRSSIALGISKIALDLSFTSDQLETVAYMVSDFRGEIKLHKIRELIDLFGFETTMKAYNLKLETLDYKAKMHNLCMVIERFPEHNHGDLMYELHCSFVNSGIKYFDSYLSKTL